MLALLIAVVFGAAVGYFATQNTIPVTVRIAEYAIEEVPLYLVVIGSLLIGLFVAWILYVARSVSSSIGSRVRSRAFSTSRSRTRFSKSAIVSRARRTSVFLPRIARDEDTERAT